MTTSSMKLLRQYQYDPLDRLTGVTSADRASTQRFYQEDDLVTEVADQVQLTILRHGEAPLAQQQSVSGVASTMLLATDQAHSVLETLTGTNRQQMAYTAYGHRTGESGLSSLLGFNGETRDAVTGHYLLGQGKRAFNPVLMRFTSPDELSPFAEGGINPYAYCGADPINFYDPTGNSRNPFQPWNSPDSNVGWNYIKRPSVIVNPLYKTATPINKSGRLSPPTNKFSQPKETSAALTSPVTPFEYSLEATQPFKPRVNNPKDYQTIKNRELTKYGLTYDQYKKDPNFKTFSTPELESHWLKLNENLNNFETSGKLPHLRSYIVNNLRVATLQIKKFSVQHHDTLMKSQQNVRKNQVY